MTSCLLCHRDLEPTERQTCVRCLGQLRRHLARISALFALLPGLMANLGAAAALDSVLARGGDDATLPGGDLLVLMGPGSASHVGHPSDPPAVAFELRQWAEDWAEIRSERGLPWSVAELSGWLSTRAGWAADHHPAVDEFASDMDRIVVVLEEVTGTCDRPERGAPCIYCRTVDLEREFTDKGRVDDWVCPRCRRVFPEAHYWLAVRMALEDARAQAEAEAELEREAG